ncbi:hypothetical protein AAHA92_12903 [Salvia divinorum]|uniref:Disease resistance R13L4/SHOC-2-like LRR domain-containing protein n=1 Tax=Salvia divinorum TaxID=28513 RepID=A0ABD1H6M1_SALDI
MAAYAALASLAQTTNLDTNHAISHFPINAKENIASIHEYVIILLTFLEDYPERANRWESKLRDVACETEDVMEEFMWRQLYYGGEEISSLNFEEELKNVTEKFCLIAGDVMDERPAYSCLSLLTSATAARVSATGNEGMINERRISLRLSGLDDIWCPTIHTILCFQLQSFPSSPSFLRRFRSLRTLNAVSETSEELSSQVFELFYLRYLTLVCSSSIPSAIANLVNLQTLIILPIPDMVPTSRRLQTIFKRKRHWRGSTDFSMPLEIWRMPQLRHLIFYNPCILPHPPNGSNIPLENIQTLTYIKDLVWTEKILQMIPNVKRLGLVYQMDQRCHLHLLKHVLQLQKLELYGLCGFPWMGYNLFTLPRTLKKLTLQGGEFPWEDMSIIGSLPYLQVLKLIDQTTGKTWETADGEFPELRYLLIEGSCLQHWITESSHFPRLKWLMLRFCQDLREIPEAIGNIPTLELIEVDFRNESLVKSAKQIYEDQQSYGNYDLHVRVPSYEHLEIMRRQRQRRKLLWRNSRISPIPSGISPNFRQERSTRHLSLGKWLLSVIHCWSSDISISKYFRLGNPPSTVSQN